MSPPETPRGTNLLGPHADAASAYFTAVAGLLAFAAILWVRLQINLTTIAHVEVAIEEWRLTGADVALGFGTSGKTALWCLTDFPASAAAFCAGI